MHIGLKATHILVGGFFPILKHMSSSMGLGLSHILWKIKKCIFNGNSRILKWRYCTIFLPIFLVVGDFLYITIYEMENKIMFQSPPTSIFHIMPSTIVDNWPSQHPTLFGRSSRVMNTKNHPGWLISMNSTNYPLVMTNIATGNGP